MPAIKSMKSRHIHKWNHHLQKRYFRCLILIQQQTLISQCFIHKSDVATWRTASVWRRKTPREPAKEQIQNNFPLYVAGKRFVVKIIKHLKGYKINCLRNKIMFFKVTGDLNNTNWCQYYFPHFLNNTNCGLGNNDACMI